MPVTETQRRRAQGLGRPKKRKTEPETGTETGSPPATTAADTDTDAGAADVIIVGGSPAAKEKIESDSDISNLDPDLTASTSVLKVKYSTVRLYSNAIINLYTQQKTRGENPAPHPNGLAKQELIRHTLREAACQSWKE